MIIYIGDRLQQCSWQTAVEKLKTLLLETPASKISFLCSVNTDLNTLNESKELANILGIQNFGYPRNFDFSSNTETKKLTNT